MNRRTFMKIATVAGISATLPVGFTALATTVALRPLPIPPLLLPDATGKITLTVQAGKTVWKNTPTTTWGINGALLGPAIVLNRGQKVAMAVQNTLAETTAIHWHGVEVPGASDGGPQSSINPQETWNTEFTVDQQAATCWFHPHPHGKTGRHVAMGLGGLLLIEDENSQKLPLPKTWGVDDIPVILQDKRLGADNQIDYTIDMVSAAVGWFGDLPLTNGVVYPQHTPPRGWLRLRLLNGCNARTLRIACSDNRPMYVIASDGGFLPEPVEVRELGVYMGERFEVLVDCRDGKPFELVTLPVKQMGMTLAPFDTLLPVLHIVPTQETGHKTLPDALVALPLMPALNDLPKRIFKLSMDPRLDKQGMEELMQRYGHAAMAGMSMDMHDGHGTAKAPSMQMDHSTMNQKDMGHGAMGHSAAPAEKPFDLLHSNFINDAAFAMNTPAFDVKQGQYERWVISGVGDMMLHPFHIHGTQFRILTENGASPAKHRQGLKDIVFVEGKESEVLVRFSHSAPKEHMYMAHCHLLEHEDTGMMMSFTVTP